MYFKLCHMNNSFFSVKLSQIKKIHNGKRLNCFGKPNNPTMKQSKQTKKQKTQQNNNTIK